MRLVRDGIVIHEGEIASLQRFKDDVKEVRRRLRVRPELTTSRKATSWKPSPWSRSSSTTHQGAAACGEIMYLARSSVGAPQR